MYFDIMHTQKRKGENDIYDKKQCNINIQLLHIKKYIN